MKKLRILYIIPSLRLCNGVASYAMNYYRNINKEKVQIDFIIGVDEESAYFEEIKKNGGNIYYIPKICVTNFFSSIKKIKEFFIKNSSKYNIIHCHVINMGAFYLHYAKKYNIKTRILHSHDTKTAYSKFNEIRNKFLLIFAKRNANYFCACSYDAGSKIFKNKKFKVINNAINGKRFVFNEEIREKVRKEYKIDKNALVIGNVGRLCTQKNQEFLINVYNLVKMKEKNSKLIIVGNGPLEKKLKEQVDKMNLNKDVLFVNTMINIEKMYQAFDIFVLPSIAEGFGIVLIEAQTSGLPCVVSDVVPKEAEISSKYYRKSLNDDLEEWSKTILNLKDGKRENGLESLIKNNYNISTEAINLEKYYFEITNN